MRPGERGNVRKTYCANRNYRSVSEMMNSLGDNHEETGRKQWLQLKVIPHGGGADSEVWSRSSMS